MHSTCHISIKFSGFERKLNTHLKMLEEIKDKPGRSFTTVIEVENIIVKISNLM
jgi:hypothetical protein